MEICRVFEVLHSHAKTFLAHVGPLKNHISGLLDRFLVFRGQLLASKALLQHVLLARDEDLLIYVLNEGLNEGRADFLDPLLEPDIVVEELTLACQNAQIDRKVIVVAVDNLDQTVLDVLGDVEHPR